MTRKRDAEPYLRKAEEYLAAGRAAADEGYFNAACSLAVTAGINAKDVVCILTVGQTDKSDDHRRAVSELTKSGEAGARMAPALDRLLRLKTKAQYSAVSVSRRDAEDSVTRAGRLVADARELFNSGP